MAGNIVRTYRQERLLLARRQPEEARGDALEGQHGTSAGTEGGEADDRGLGGGGGDRADSTER